MQKYDFKQKFLAFTAIAQKYMATKDNQWKIKGFIDIQKNIFPISSDTKIISKVIEIHLFPEILKFAEQNQYIVELPKHQNYYPDLTFIHKENNKIKFAVDLKTTYRNPQNKKECNGFTLGSHGEYFINRNSSKNIHYPYKEYLGHYCLGIIYDRIKKSAKPTYKISEIQSIASVIENLQIFFVEKYRIASDKGGSGNTANIGSIKNIDNIINGKGTFYKLGEDIFDDYWINYGKIIHPKTNKPIRDIKTYLEYRGIKI